MLRLDINKSDEILNFLSANLNYASKEILFENFLINDPGYSVPALDSNLQKQYSYLKNDGISNLGSLLSKEEVADIHQYIQDKKVFAGHTVMNLSASGEMTLQEATKISSFACYDREIIFKAPHLVKLANSQSVINIVENYLKTLPILYDVGLIWSVPKDEVNVYSQVFHRDVDDVKFVTLFTYLTDVENIDDGAHSYIKGSHDCQQMKQYFKNNRLSGASFKLKKLMTSFRSILNARKLGYKFAGYGNKYIPDVSYEEFINSHKLHPYYDLMMKEKIVNVLGNSGTTFISDNQGFHKGNIPKNKKRLLFWARYGISNNPVSRIKNKNKLLFSNLSNENIYKNKEINSHIFDFNQ